MRQLILLPSLLAASIFCVTSACGGSDDANPGNPPSNDGGAVDSTTDAPAIPDGASDASGDVAGEVGSTQDSGGGDASDGASEDASDAGADASDGASPLDAGTDASDAGRHDAGDADAGRRVCPPAKPTGTQSVAYQIDVAHTGAQPTDQIATPLCQRWSHDLGAPGSYALVANGRVFVTFSEPQAAIIALDERTGETLWGPVGLGSAYDWVNAAYDNGHVFVVNNEGKLQSLNEATGAVEWVVSLPGQYMFTSPPTAFEGRVYVGGAGGGGTVYGVDEANGNVAWTAGVMNGDHSSPALAPSGVYVSYACDQAYGFSPGDGGLLWHATGPCEGGGGKTVSLYQGKLYARDSTGNEVLSAADGGVLGTFSATYIPSFSQSVGYYVTAGVLSAIPVGGATPTWTFGTATDPVVAPPVVVGSLALTATGSTLYALSVADGKVVSSDALAGVPSPDEQNARVLTGLAAADGMLFVPAGNAIVAY